MRFMFNAEGGAGGGGGGGNPPDWRATLPEAIRNDPSLASFKDVGALAESFIQTKSLVGASVRPPGPNAKPEDKKAFVDRLLQIEPALAYLPDNDPETPNRLWKRLGRPEKPEEYEIAEEAKAAGLNADELRMLAVTGGMTKAQFKSLTEVMGKATLEQKRVQALERVALETEWGEAKEERTLAAKAAALKMGLTEPEVEALSPKQLRAFHNVARAVGVKTNEFRRAGDSEGDMLDPQEAQRQQAEIRANPDFLDPYKNPAKHAALVKEMSRLAPMAYPGRR